MRKLFLLLLVSALCFNLNAQSKGYKFEVIKENPITSIKNQFRSSTCWSFSADAFLEAELIRLGKDSVDISEAFIVRHSMTDRAINYVRLHGEGSFGPGGSFYDVLYTCKEHGVVPEYAMTGLVHGAKLFNHSELDNLVGSYVKSVANSDAKTLSPSWKEGLEGIEDAYFGKYPTEFEYNGKKYTPKSFSDYLGLKYDDYVSITSFTHHPFYSQFPIRVPDNWRNAMSYNLPLDEMMEVIDNAITEGYTVAWGADVSEQGFTRNGIAVVPDLDAENTIGSDQAHWLGLSKSQRFSESMSSPAPEKVITQEMRQEDYDNWKTTDDHGMLMYGKAKDQNGTIYWMIKNSWGTNNKYKGTWYISDSFVRFKTMNFVVHKKAIPRSIRRKLGIR